MFHGSKLASYRRRLSLAVIFLLGLTLLFSAPPAVLHAEDNEIKVERLEPVQYDNEPSPSYMIVELSYPAHLGKGSFEFTVDGNPALSKDSYYGNGNARFYIGYLLYVGEPGKKTIEASFKSRVKTSPIQFQTEFKSTGDIVLLENIDGGSVFDNDGLRFWSYFSKDFYLRVNGKDVAVKAETLAGAPGIVGMTSEPCLQPGLNQVEYGGVNFAGQSIARTLNIYWIQDGKVKVGDRFDFHYGFIGSKSGPFFELELGGNFLSFVGTSRMTSIPTLMGPWLASRTDFAQTIEAKSVGNTAIKIMKKQYFMDKGYKLHHKIDLTVTN